MPNTVQAKKRVKQNKYRAANNKSQKSAIRTAIKKVRKLAQTDLSAASLVFRHASCLLDRAGRKRLLHPRKTDRLKSRLNAYLKRIHFSQKEALAVAS